MHDRYKAALEVAKKSLNKKWIDKGKVMKTTKAYISECLSEVESVA